MSKELTISGIELASACLYPFRKDVEYPAFTGNEYSIRGSACHNAIEAILTGQELPELDTLGAEFVDKWRQRYRRDDFGAAMPELAIAVNKITGDVRILGAGIDREYKAYGATDEEICGSIDLTSNPAGIITVWEWKFGQQWTLTRYQNPQAEAYAAIIGRLLGVPVVRAITVVINESGVFEYEHDVSDFDGVIGRLLALNEELELGDPQPKPGSHCRTKYCPVAATCPALHGEVQALTKQVPVPLATKADVARTIERLYALEAQATAIWKAVDARVKELGEDIELPNGKSYGMKETPRESILATEGAREYLRSKLGEKIDEAVKVSISKDSIKEAVKLVAKKGKGAAMYREIEETLREMGAVKESVSVGLGLK